MKIRNLFSAYDRYRKEIDKKLPVFGFVDYVYEIKVKHLLHQEYFAFDFYNKSKKERNEYVYGWEVMHTIPDKYNDKEQTKYLDDKSKFDVLFSDMLGRDYLVVNHEAKDSYLSFIKKHEDFIVKPLEEWGGSGIRKVFNATNEIFDSLITQYENCIIEELFSQNEKMASLNPDTVNTLRVLAFRDKAGQVQIPFVNIRIGRKGADVDNFCSGGMTAAIDVLTGKVVTDAFDKDYHSYHIHPDTGVDINGFVVPYWDDVLATVKTAMDRLPKMRYVGWDVVISKDNQICLIEGNHNPEARIHQISQGRGLRSEYTKFLGKF